MLYELAKLTVRIGATSQAVAGIKTYLSEAGTKGKLVGCWFSEIGELNKVAVLRSFADPEEAKVERRRALASSAPFNCRDVLTHIELDSYMAFPGIPPIEPGRLGPIYEIRTYALKPGGLAGTIATWGTSLPKRRELSPNLVVMHTLEGPPRFTHIWPYPSLEQRAAIRAKSVSLGVWPPPGGADFIEVMANGIWLPTEISPLQ